MTTHSLPTDASSETTFKLLVPEPVSKDSLARSVTLGGTRWVLVDQAPISLGIRPPDFTCISYSWGRGRVASPLDDARMISGRTLPAIEAAIRAQPRPTALWVDALCVPTQGPARDACLRNMGAIYATAAEVVAVLSPASARLLAKICNKESVDSIAVLALEDDDWVTRAWTYQEIVNSRKTRFVAEGGGDASVPGNELLSAVMGGISDFKKAHGLDSFQFRVQYPKLDSLEGLIGDYMTSDYVQRSAYQVMCAMDPRRSEQPDDYFGAMIGAITTTPVGPDASAPLHASEHFMAVCEMKGDYSFVYSRAPRSDTPGRSWRPASGRMSAVLPFHSFGESQRGCLHPTHLQLTDMYRATSGPLNADARKLIDWWLQADHTGESCRDLAALLLERLRQVGFTGCGEHMEFECGYFFPQQALPLEDETTVAVATGVRWSFGAPGLVVRAMGADMHRYRDVGVFVGRVPKTGEALNVA